MRRSATQAERLLWQRLRRGQLGVRFRKQVAIGQFIADFFCPARDLVVEVDGGVHDDRRDIDEERDRMLGRLGVRVLHVRNEEVLHDLDGVVRRIAAALQE
jgi:very-short-patch-repair endonuclease